MMIFFTFLSGFTFEQIWTEAQKRASQLRQQQRLEARKVRRREVAVRGAVVRYRLLCVDRQAGLLSFEVGFYYWDALLMLLTWSMFVNTIWVFKSYFLCANNVLLIKK